MKDCLKIFILFLNRLIINTMSWKNVMIIKIRQCALMGAGILGL